jgi:hypothetical protein
MGVISGTTLAVVAGIGAAGSVAGSLISSSAAGKAAKAQEAAGADAVRLAQEAEMRQRADRERAFNEMMQFADASPRELASMSRLVSNQEQFFEAQMNKIEEMQGILDQVDPALKAASGNLTNLLNGERAKILDPILKQRDRQKIELEQNLVRTMGGGFRGSSAGLLALNRFDEDTSVLSSQAQFQAINQTLSATQGLGALSGNIRESQAGRLAAAFQQSIQAEQTILGAEGRIQGRGQAAASILAGGISPLGASAAQNFSQLAGGQFAGDIAFGQSLGSLGAGIAQGATQGAITQSTLAGLQGGTSSAIPSGFSQAAQQPFTFKSPTFGDFG